MTKLSAELDQLMRCCMFGSSNMLWNGQSLFPLYSYRTDVLVQFVDKRSLDDLRLVDGSSRRSRSRC